MNTITQSVKVELYFFIFFIIIFFGGRGGGNWLHLIMLYGHVWITLICIEYQFYYTYIINADEYH